MAILTARSSPPAIHYSMLVYVHKSQKDSHIVVTHLIKDARDHNDFDKTRGFLNHSEAALEFIGPDREPVQLDSIDKCLQIANIFRDIGCHNYSRPAYQLFQVCLFQLGSITFGTILTGS